MDVKNALDLRRFLPDKIAKTTLFESERMFCDVYGISAGQEQKAHVHDASDKIYYVIEGCGIFKVGEDVREVGERNVVVVPAGAEHSVKNDGAAPLTLLVFMAPHPNYVRKGI